MPVIQTDGETIYYEDVGEGPPILFIHSLGTNSYLYRAQIEVLKNKYRCIAPDCRGHGNSSYNGLFTVEDAANDHKALLDTLNISSCHIIGLSMGGPILLNLISRWPEIAQSVVIADSFARIRPGGEDRIYATQEAVAYLSMQEFGSQYAGDRLMPTTPIEKLDELALEIAKCPSKAYVDTVRAIFTYDASSDLDNVKVSALILVGDNDDATPIAESEFIKAGIPGSKLVTIPNAGHLSTIDSPEAFTHELELFFEGL
jgi:pimeloyl-ACP methyl ester carboxylesterase